jgi:hypothetical protein
MLLAGQLLHHLRADRGLRPLGIATGLLEQHYLIASSAAWAIRSRLLHALQLVCLPWVTSAWRQKRGLEY